STSSAEALWLIDATEGAGAGADIDNLSCSCAHVVIDIMALTGTTPSATFIEQGKDVASGISPSQSPSPPRRGQRGLGSRLKSAVGKAFGGSRRKKSSGGFASYEGCSDLRISKVGPTT
ncbi:hypothetical protein, partial [Ensifer aridi]|uniref:hypothetical protein n=1 Tax=Ensifer aridi TaxID=1708715 RepID=UPI001AEC76A9